MSKLIVTQGEDGRFECAKDGDCGACVVGRGSSVLEAVGSWAIYSSTVEIRCNPPAVLREFHIINKYENLKFDSPPTR